MSDPKAHTDVRSDRIQCVGKPGPGGRKSVKLQLAGEVRVSNEAQLPKDVPVTVVIGEAPGPDFENASRVISIELPDGKIIETL